MTTWPPWAWESEREGKERATNSLTKCLGLFSWPSLVAGRTQEMKKACAFFAFFFLILGIRERRAVVTSG